jgi:hypothetical protein
MNKVNDTKESIEKLENTIVNMDGIEPIEIECKKWLRNSEMEEIQAKIIGDQELDLGQVMAGNMISVKGNIKDIQGYSKLLIQKFCPDFDMESIRRYAPNT